MTNSIDPIIETIIFLKEEACYIEPSKFYRVTCPDGFSGDLKRTLSANCIDMQLWQHLGANVEEIPTP